MIRKQGASADADRATHERGQSPLSPPSVGIPSAVGISSSACFCPEEDDPETFDGSTVTWTFELPKQTRTGPGLYQIEFIRNLTADERSQKSATLLASTIELAEQSA